MAVSERPLFALLAFLLLSLQHGRSVLVIEDGCDREGHHVTPFGEPAVYRAGIRRFRDDGAAPVESVPPSDHLDIGRWGSAGFEEPRNGRCVRLPGHSPNN